MCIITTISFTLRSNNIIELFSIQRFNVAVTRAIALLIVIGNPDILQCDPNWRSLIEYCVENDSYNGPLPSYSVPSDFQPIEKLGLDLSVLTPNAGTYN